MDANIAGTGATTLLQVEPTSLAQVSQQVGALPSLIQSDVVQTLQYASQSAAQGWQLGPALAAYQQLVEQQLRQVRLLAGQIEEWSTLLAQQAQEYILADRVGRPAGSTLGAGKEPGLLRGGRVVTQLNVNTSVTAGSSVPWTGSGAAPQWNNPKSQKAYDHIESTHGPRRPARELIDRARQRNSNQGQWYDPQYWVEAEQVTPQHPGKYLIEFDHTVGRVYAPDGSITEGATRAVVIRLPDGTLDSAYPVDNAYILH